MNMNMNVCQHPPKRPVAALLFLVAAAITLLGGAEAFLAPSSSSITTKRASQSLDSLPKRLVTSLLEQQQQSFAQTSKGATLAGGSIAFPTLFLGSAAPNFDAASLPDPTLSQEAHVFAELSHLGLDFATFLFGGTGVVALRAVTVLGRVCAILADYIPDHSMLPDELLFQVFMLSVSSFALVQAALPTAFSITASNISLKDGKAFATLFAPSGTTWAQFKALLAVQALDWVTLEPEETVSTRAADAASTTNDSKSGKKTNEDDDEEYIYWLYSGTVAVHETSNDGAMASHYNVSASRRREDAGRGLLGERRLLRRLNEKSKNQSGNKKKRSDSSSSDAPASSTSPSRSTLTVTATAPDTTLLRIHTGNLHLLMNNDQQLADSIRSMLFSSLEAKLNAHEQQLAFNVTA